MYTPIRNALFKLDPELAHELSLDLLGAAERLRLLPLFKPAFSPSPRTVMGLKFDNAVGLAAGLDKNGDYFNALGGLGFGFVEIGTVTPKPQEGNPRPRLFRVPEHKAIINRMGFNNKGIDYLVAQVKRRRFTGVLGINIGKNKLTPESEALDDYRYCLERAYPLADYITINISSPNTPGLRALQHGSALDNLMSGIRQCREQLQQRFDKYVPIAVKIAPDNDGDTLRVIVDTLIKHDMDAVIATNTTVDHDAIAGHALSAEAGGLSGKPLLERSTEIVRILKRHVGEALPIIAVGGIFDGESARQKIEAGASLVQVYSGFIYRGPSLIGEIARATQK